MQEELEEYYEKLMRDKEKRLLSEVKVVEKEIDGEIEEVIMVRSDEIGKDEIDELPKTLSAFPFGDSTEVLGRTCIFYSGSGEYSGKHREEQLKEESLAELVARV